MKIANGNEKLGTNCYVISRPVETTCPKLCPFLNLGCYAEQTEKRFPKARRAGFDNISVTKEEVKQLIDKALTKNKIIRLMERGDWLLNDKIDYDFLNTWKDALREFTTLPKIFGYTHVPHKDISDLINYGVNMYLSVHSEEDIKKGLKANFSLFAYVVKDKKKRGGSKDYPKRLNIPMLGNLLICPEQRKGRNHTTCTGSSVPKTTACQYCCKGLNSIIFLTH